MGGLTAALCMLKAGFDVTVYEKTSAFARFGGPIQFASNALSVLKEIDDSLFDRVMEKFTFTGIRTCGIKDGASPRHPLPNAGRMVMMIRPGRVLGGVVSSSSSQ